ncbi:MAG: hypothetical protein NZ482_03640 [Gloeomargarita sp. SKYG98]|nr:hypothetical protein [Gloeomargarita sp. SKYG98]
MSITDVVTRDSHSFPGWEDLFVGQDGQVLPVVVVEVPESSPYRRLPLS